ncbi:unannotated protein [freshwater metagenome]|uniref:Unannotated protein n=1 Tax=freshwater metagenome TaxID=449393 RepID=A0A6J7GR35_9ZZZZ|nr:hypothetical protein [Actinomycetota bacterium]
MRRIITLALASAIAIPLAGFATSAQAAPRADRIFLHVDTRTIIDVGATGSSLGDLTITHGTLANTLEGDKIGSWTARLVVVVPGATKERRDTLLHFILPGGVLMTRGIYESPSGKLPSEPHRIAIIGGTGDYFGARGQVVLTPLGDGNLRLDMEYVPTSSDNAFGTDRLRRVVSDIITDNVAGTASMTVTAQTLRGFLRVEGERFPFVCAQTSGDPEGIGVPIIDSWICQYSLRGGSILTTSQTSTPAGTRERSGFTQAIIGGTGEWAGSVGQTSIPAADWTTNGTLSVCVAFVGGTYITTRQGPSDRLRTGRWVADLGSGGLGQIVVSSATINFGESPSMGYTVASGPSGDRRITDFVFRISGLPGLQGALYGTALFTTANGQAPNAPYLILVNGGTGPWRGASGILRVVPTSAEGATINVNMLVMALK